jgi:hypothetical protein
MINLIDYILDLFRDEGQAQAFVANPDQALANAGLSTVSSAQLQSVAATAVPSLALGGSGDAVADLQQAVSGHYGFEPSFAPQPDFSPSTDLASNNSFMSPTTNITDDHSVSFGMGDITLGDKTTAQGDGAVAVGGSTHGDIVSGDGAVLGNGNTVNNGDIHNTSAGGDVLSSHDGTVIQTSGHGTTTVSDGNTTSVHGNQTVTDIHGTGNTSAVDNSSTLTHTSTIDNSEHDSSVHSSSIVDASVHDNSVHDSSVHDSSVHDTSSHDNSIHAATHTDTGLDAHLGF